MGRKRWRCADSLSLRQFLGLPLDEATPDHSTLTNTRNRLPHEVFEEVFQFVLRITAGKKLLAGKTVGVDSTLLEADAAMKSIVRRDTGDDWKQYVTRLMREDGTITPEEEPSDDEIRRYDKKRKNKQVSNDEWMSPNDPESRIAKLKDARRVAQVCQTAEELGNMYVLSSARGFGSYLVSLGADDAEKAVSDLDCAARSWTKEGFHIQHMDIYGGRVLIDIYTKKGRAAWQRVQEAWPELRTSGLLRVEVFWAYNHFLSARAAVACALDGGDREQLIKRAKRMGRKLARQPASWIRALGQLTLANVALLQGENSSAIDLLTDAGKLFGQTGMMLLEHCTYFRLSQLSADETSTIYGERAHVWFETHSVRNHQKMSELFVACGHPDPL